MRSSASTIGLQKLPVARASRSCRASPGTPATPVPGDVGPMTVALLLRNTLRAFEHAVAS
ncbi:MAG: hypothetical protein ACM362_13595 [Candidatus Methylomirabilota bacterium]